MNITSTITNTSTKVEDKPAHINKKLTVSNFNFSILKKNCKYFTFLIKKFQLDASIISCIITLVTISIFLHINYLFKLISMILTVVGHLMLFACVLADGENIEDFAPR